MNTPMKIVDYMSTAVATAHVRDGLHQTHHRMQLHAIRHMPVVNDAGDLVGMISDRDLRRPDKLDALPPEDAVYRLDNDQMVIDVMTPNPITVHPSDGLRTALSVFIHRKFGALPVVDGDNKLVGIVSAHDLLKAFDDLLARLTSDVRA